MSVTGAQGNQPTVQEHSIPATKLPKLSVQQVVLWITNFSYFLHQKRIGLQVSTEMNQPPLNFGQLQNNCFGAPSHSSFQHLRNICSLLYCCFPNLRAPPFLVPVQHEHGQSSAVLRLIPVIITNIPNCISPLPISAFCSLHLKSELKVRIVFFFVLGLDDNFSSQQ